MLAALVLCMQAGAWTARPSRATVGDTIWLERQLAVPAGWGVRAGKLEATADIEPLGNPAVLRSPNGFLVRYAVVAWTAGPSTLTLPLIWRLAPDGRADSSAGGTASFVVTSVIPDTVKRPAPQALLAPLRPERRNPLWPLASVLCAVALLALLVVRRRRGLGPNVAAPRIPVDGEVPDTRWLATGEPKAVAARAIGRLRTALARAVPEAHLGLATPECLATLARVRPGAPVRELGALLDQLDRVAFASAHGTDVAALAAAALRMAKELTP